MEKIRTMPDSDLEYLDEKFVTFLSDGKEYELVPNGKNILVTPVNKSLYIELTKTCASRFARKTFPTDPGRLPFHGSGTLHDAADSRSSGEGDSAG
jgi:hypothetical protein